MNKHIKLISILLLLCLIFTGCGKKKPVEGAKRFSDDGFGKIDGIEWYFHADSGLLEVNGTGSIEADLDRYQWKDFKEGVKECVIGEGITSIGSYAFDNMEYCTKLTLPNTLTDLLYSSFSSGGFENVTVPASVTNIEYGVFAHCHNLTSVTILGKEIGYGMFQDTSYLREVHVTDNLEVIGPDAFASSRIRSFEIGPSIKEISDNAFFGANLSSIVIPATLETLGEDAFAQCHSLATVEIHIEEVPSGSFDADGIKCIRLGDEVRTLRSSFTGGHNLKDVYIPATVTEIEDGAFTGIKELNIYTTKGSAAWEYCGTHGDIKFVDINEPGNMENFEKAWEKAIEEVK